MPTVVRTLVLPLLLTLAGVAGAQAQTLADLRAALEEGGGWVPIRIEEGKARVQTTAVPTGGILLRGYVQIWEGNPGAWTIKASDPLNQTPDEEPILDLVARAGQRIEFSRRTGLVSRLDIDIRWSEEEDTTLWVWVGLGDDPPPPTRRGSGR